MKMKKMDHHSFFCTLRKTSPVRILHYRDYANRKASEELALPVWVISPHFFGRPKENRGCVESPRPRSRISGHHALSLPASRSSEAFICRKMVQANGINGHAPSSQQPLWPSTNERGYSIPDQPCGTLHHRKVICVGAGISGICLAHEVSTKGKNLDLTIYDVASG